MEDIGSAGLLPMLSYNRSSDPPDQNLDSKLRERCFTCRKVPIFSIIIAHDQTEAAISPIMTALVTVSELQTISHIDICWAASAKFCVSIFYLIFTIKIRRPAKRPVIYRKDNIKS